MAQGKKSGRGRRKKKYQIVKWRNDNPNGSKAACYRETGISLTTIRKWWGYGEQKRERMRGVSSDSDAGTGST